MSINLNTPEEQTFFVHPCGKSYGRLEEEQVMPFIVANIPDDIESFLYVGKGGDEELPAHFKPWETKIKTLDIQPDYKPDIIADIRATGLPGASFDAIALLAVIEHIFEKEQVVAECHRLLTPGGILIVSVPWIFPYHIDDGVGDFWRISHEGLALMLERHFKQVNIVRSYWASYGWAVKDGSD